ncbi:MAG TPA: hypothetical protein VK558_04230 [Patescibacteria group bacterium]|nr:hypothetical protein [Patescibacteria group bacterium]
MIRVMTAAMLAAFLASPVFAQNSPPNYGVNGLNGRGTIGDAPDYGATPPAAPDDCTPSDTRAACQQAAAPNEEMSDPKTKSDTKDQPDIGRSLDTKAPEPAPSGY